MEDDDILELEPDGEEPPPEVTQWWRLIGRCVSQKKPDIQDMSTHFDDVWHLRTGVNFAPIGKNWFNDTLFSEGDFNFVARGGPWIYRGYPLLVAKIKKGVRPSETVLNTVPIWVQVYDIPWNKKMEKTARLIGDKIGKFLEADMNADGYSPYEFLRARVDMDRRLRASLTTQVKGDATTSTYLMRYERVPYFCFWYGFIGHDDKFCEKRRTCVPSIEYDTRLRCSPVHKFEKRQAYVPPKQHLYVRKELNLSSSGDNSDNLGIPKDRRWNRNVVFHTGNHVPVRIDARDGFEEAEAEGSSEVDASLAEQINRLNLPLVRTDLYRDNVEKPRVIKKTTGRMGRGKGTR
jgi:hypothetical protein